MNRVNTPSPPIYTHTSSGRGANDKAKGSIFHSLSELMGKRTGHRTLKAEAFTLEWGKVFSFLFSYPQSVGLTQVASAWTELSSFICSKADKKNFNVSQLKM